MKASVICPLLLCCLLLTGCDFLKSFYGDKEQSPPPPPPKPAPVVKKTPKPKPEPKPGPMVIQEEPEPAPVFPWHEILGPSQAELPDPRPSLNWSNDLQGALSEAVLEGRPLFIMVSCSKPEFDQWTEIQKKISEPSPELSELLRQFITLEITDTRNMNLNVLPFWKYQDPDNSLWLYLLSDLGQVYSVFGGRDHRNNYERITMDGVSAALKHVLQHHYDPRRDDWNNEWNLDGPAPLQTHMRPENLPAYNKWLRVAKGGAAPPALDFYEIYDIYYHDQYIKSGGKFSQKWIWPYPENIGLQMDPKDTLIVQNVTPGSVAAKAGILPGDVLGAAQNKRLFTETDLRVQLHQASVDLELHWVSQGQIKNAQLIMPANWKQTELNWRLTSLYSIHGGPIPGFIVAPVENKIRNALRIPPNLFAGYIISKPGTAAHDAWRMGINELILVKINDAPIPNMPPTRFLAWFRNNYKHNQPMRYGVITNNGKKRFNISNRVFTLEYAPYNRTVSDSLD